MSNNQPENTFKQKLKERLLLEDSHNNPTCESEPESRKIASLKNCPAGKSSFKFPGHVRYQEHLASYLADPGRKSVDYQTAHFQQEQEEIRDSKNKNNTTSIADFEYFKPNSQPENAKHDRSNSRVKNFCSFRRKNERILEQDKFSTVFHLNFLL